MRPMPEPNPQTPADQHSADTETPAMLVDSVGAILLISDDAEKLAAFYREALGFPLEDEVHEGVPLHYGCEIGAVHFAIHPSADWPGRPGPDSQSPVIVFYTSDVEATYQRLVANGVQATPPFDHGFATMTAFRDPDGNNVQVMTPNQ
jgi:catechol 2,3-dioxygenase-like lactoylglutathione lyase family enzyme